MTVNELVDLLAQLIAEGRGNDQGRFDDRAMDVLDASNWEAYELNLNDGRSGFVGINARPETS